MVLVRIALKRPYTFVVMAMFIVIFGGMAPTALNAEQNAPLGRAVIGGLIFATVATLIFVPVVFGVAHSRKTEVFGRGVT